MKVDHVSLFLACLCKAVARQVDEVPFLSLFLFVHGSSGLDGVVVDGSCLARFAADVGAAFLPEEVVIKKDFPTFECPMKAISFRPSFTYCLPVVTAELKYTDEKI